jgi:hypothetical protein
MKDKEELKTLKDLGNEPIVRAYVLYVFRRWEFSNEFLQNYKDYSKRSPESIKQMERVRQDLHEYAFNFLKKKGFSEDEISIFLENECEKETKRVLPELSEGECYCGACRVVVKVKDFSEHRKDHTHILINEYLPDLVRLQQEVKLEMMRSMAK